MTIAQQKGRDQNQEEKQMNLSRLDTRHIIALYRVAKTRAYPFFRDPKAMIALRTEYERRVFPPWQGPPCPPLSERKKHVSSQ